MRENDVIGIENLSKSFGSVRALDGVSLAVRTGTVTAVLGPNASGKSTLIKCILGLVNPDEGEVHLEGAPVKGEWRYRARIGYMPQSAKFPENLTVDELFALLKDIRKDLPGSGALDTELHERFGLSAIGRRRLGVLSGGTRQRINAAIAFLFAPPLLILDEPTVGLDPLSAVILRDKIRDQRAGGRTVLLTSHLVGEVEEMADHVVYMLEGRPFFDGSIEDLRRITAERKLERAIVRLMEENRSGASGQNTDLRNS